MRGITLELKLLNFWYLTLIFSFCTLSYEFDVGIHYIGEMFDGALNKTFLDQITDGQLEWNRLDEEYDMVSIGYGKNQRKYPVPAGFKKWIELLKKEFPKEHSAIDEYFGLLKSCGGHSMINGLLKVGC